jgi:hypothetical protein
MADNTAPDADTTLDAADAGREPSALDDQALYARLKGWFKEGSTASTEWRRDAREDFAFVAGDQWTDEDKAIMAETMRPMATFNGIEPIIENVAGLEINNRQETKYYPREINDAGPTEMLTDAADWARDGCDAEDEESDAFREAAICGMGWTHTFMNYDEEPEGKIVIERVDPLDCYWDASARKKNLADARWVARVKELDLTEAKAEWPGHDDADYHASWASEVDADEPHVRIFGRQYETPDSKGTRSPTRGKVRVVEVQWSERELAGYNVADPSTNAAVTMSAEEWKIVRERLKAMGVDTPPAAKIMRRAYHRAILGATVLDSGALGEEDDPIPGFTLRAITGKRDRNNGTWYGLVRGLKDPQRWKNKFFSTIQETMARSGKGIMAEKTAPADGNVRAFEANWARPDKVKWVRDGAIAKGQVQVIPPTPLPAGIGDMLAFADQSLYRVSGINLEMMGMADREQAGILEQQRKQSAITILAPLFDALRRYRKEQGRVLLYFIQHYIPPGTLIRVQGDQGVQYLPLQRDPATRKYDVVVDEAPSSTDNKTKTWLLLQPMMPLLIQAGLPPQVWAEIVRYSPFPESLSSKIAQGIMEAAQQGGQPSPEMQALQAQAQIEGQKLQIDQAKVQAESQQKAADSQMKAQEMHVRLDLEQRKFELERAKAQFDARIKAQQLALEQHKAGVQMDMDATELGMRMAMEGDKHAADMVSKADKRRNDHNQAVIDLGKISEVIAAAEVRGQQRDEKFANLIAALAAPKAKHIRGTLPSGKPFAATVSEDGAISGP